MKILIAKDGRFLSAVLVLILGLSISVGLFFWARAAEEHELAYEFEMRAQDRAQAIEDALQDHVDITQTIVGFYNSSEFVSRREFSTFTAEILKQHPDILALDWIPLVSEQERPEFEDKIQQEGIGDFKIKELDTKNNFVPAKTRPYYFPIAYVEPFRNNKFLLGYDEGSDSGKRTAIEKARDTGRPAATHRLHLLRGSPEGYGIRVFFPVYRNGTSTVTVADRRKNLVGVVSVLSNVGQVTQMALKKLSPLGINLALYDETAKSKERFLYLYSDGAQVPSPRAVSVEQAQWREGVVYTDQFSFADRQWRIIGQPSETFGFLHNFWKSFAVLFVGLFLTIVLVLYLLMLVNREKEIRDQVNQRTRELRQAKEYAEFIFKFVPSAIFTVDQDQRVKSFNKRAEEVTGFSAQEIIGENCRKFAVEPCEHKCGVFSADVSKPIVSRECLIRNKKGDILIVSKNADLLRDEKGQVIGAIESFEDITKRKKADEELHRAAEEWQKTFDSITDFIFIQDKNHVILKVNSAFAKSLNMPPEKIVGLHCYELLHGTNSPWPRCPFEETKKDLRAHTIEVDDPKIKTPLLVTTSPIFDEKGQLNGSVHIAKDITEFKKAEAQLRKAAELKIAFTSMVSHELRTPLTAIKEGIGILADGVAGEVPPQQKEFLDIARRNVDRLARLINNVLDFQKLDSGHMEFDFQENSINDVIRDVHQTMAPLAEKKNLNFELHLDESLMRIFFDKDKIIQVVTNLVNNAIKFTDQGSVAISTHLKDNGLQVSVQDTGPGIRQEDMARVFHEFEQLANINDRKTGGTGLGLAISLQIIEQHKGKIWVESVFGHGATFSFLLPFSGQKV